MIALSRRLTTCALALAASTPLAAQDVIVRADVVHTMAGALIEDGVVLVRGGKIVAVGRRAEVEIPSGVTILECAVATPGLIDAHSVVGLSGILNQPHDQDQLERSEPLQPELDASDAYNPRDPLVEWLRGFGVTSLHTGHAPGAVLSGQTLIAKTRGDTVEEAVFVERAMLACTLGEGATKKDAKKSPGTRAKVAALLRGELVAAQEYARKHAHPGPDGAPDRDLRLEAMQPILRKERRLLVTAQRAADILTALRIAREFDLAIVLDGAAEAYLVVEEIKAAGVPVILHPTMLRPSGEGENVSFETAATLVHEGIPLALQSGFEAYVPKTRVVLFEAGAARANGLGFDEALATITRDAAKILGIAERVGTLEVGKDGDVALYDGDPFQWTTHCVGVVIEGEVVSTERR